MKGNTGLRSIEHEETILGWALKSPPEFWDVAQSLKPEHFESAPHRIAWEAVLQMSANNIPIDKASLRNTLESDGKLAAVSESAIQLWAAGGIWGHGASLNTIKAIAGLVILNSSRRTAAAAMEGLRVQSLDPAIDFRTVTTGIEELAMELSGIVQQGQLQHIQEAATIAQSEILDRVEARMEGRSISISTGIPMLDEMTGGLFGKRLTILAARPSTGKSAFALHLAHQAAQQGKTVLFFSLEMGKSEVCERLIGMTEPMSLTAIRDGHLGIVQMNKISDRIDQFGKLPLYICDKPGIQMDEISSLARQFKTKGNLGLVIVDHIGLMILDESKKAQELSTITKKQKLLAMDLNINVLALSQLNRNCETRSDKIPMMSDIRDSGEIEQNADGIWFLHRNYMFDQSADPEDALLVVAKQRNGSIGRVNLRYISPYAQFSVPL